MSGLTTYLAVRDAVGLALIVAFGMWMWWQVGS